MLNWFYRWVGKKILAASREHDEQAVETGTIGLVGANPNRAATRKSLAVRESDGLNTEPITFKMFKASGGWAIEFRQYDNRNDRVDTNLYVVNDEQELGRHISQIITMEALKR